MSRLKAIFSFLLFLGLILVLGFLAQKYRTHWDLTQNARHSLSQATVEVLRQMKGPVRITAYATEQDARLGELQKTIGDIFEPYLQVKKDMSLVFVDPSKEVKLAREAGVQVNGEVIVEYAGKREHLLVLNEEAITNLLLRFSRSSEHLVMALSGHGERRLAGEGRFDFGLFGQELAKRGIKIAGLNLGIAQEVPSNANVLILTSAKTDLLPGETEKLLKHIERGGNLLWLIDPGAPLHGLEPLLDALDLSLSPGTVFDPAAQKLRAPATWALGTRYGAHPITRNFNLVTVFPFVRQIASNEKSSFKSTALVEVAPDGWISVSGKASFDKSRDIPGPVTVAMALERMHQDKIQRVVVVGTNEFLSNGFIGSGGNMDFGINIVNWLSSDDALIAIQPRPTIDSSLMLGKTQATVMAVGWLFALPTAFLSIAAFIGWRRRAGAS